MVKRVMGIMMLLAMVACAGVFKPSDKMLQLKQGMNQQSAALVFAKYTQPFPGNSGFCGGHSFTSDESTPMNVTVDGYSIKAYNAGEFVGSERGYNVYKKAYYDATRKFSDVSSIRVVLGATVFNACTKPDKNQMKIILNFGMSDADIMHISASNLDEMMAALVTLAPQAKLIDGVGL